VTIRLYVMPLEAGIGPELSHGPKYLSWKWDPDPSNNVGVSDWVPIYYGTFDWGLFAVEASALAHSSLAAKPDLQQIPADLDSIIGSAAARDTARSFLEAAAIPGNWIGINDTWRSVVRTVAGFMLFAQRYDGIRQKDNPGAPAFGSQIEGNLNVQWGSIPIGIRDAVVETGQSFGYDMSFIVDTTLVRSILKTLADMWGDQPVYMGLELFNGGQTFTV